jgi:hypothetical protein
VPVAIGCVGETVGVREIASVSLASTVWYAWVTFKVGVVVARAGILHPARLIAQRIRMKKIIVLSVQNCFIVRRIQEVLYNKGVLSREELF